ncbi:MAG TPA: polyhydroxyalkanoate depolymerase [Acidimicrobiales bacterium]|nr:polyhydroxyalkanoate depolymerase [Acidimicrobiales bacterium]
MTFTALDSYRKPLTGVTPGASVLYPAYQTQSDLMAPLRAMARLAARASQAWRSDLPRSPMFMNLGAGYELLARMGFSHARAPFGIEHVVVDGHEVEVTEKAVDGTPFGTLLSFSTETGIERPRVLLVAPLSGHFATLLRDTVHTMVADNDVYLTDWHNARDIPLRDGRFGFDEYIEHIVRFLEVMGPGAHVVAVCQPCVAALVATAVMAQGGHPAVPRSLTLMAGPIDARINPTKVNELATSKPITWFERNLIASVPWRYPGVFRRVYPGFLQVAAFMSMNLERHVSAHRKLFADLAGNNRASASATAAFYDEYFAVLDLTAEFYLETVEKVFQRYELARGTLEWQGRLVEPAAIRRTALLTVEGERDDICAVGQTVAAHDVCPNIGPAKRGHHLQSGVGHYGVFNGRRWETQIYPIVHNVIQANI